MINLIKLWWFSLTNKSINSPTLEQSISHYVDDEFVSHEDKDNE